MSKLQIASDLHLDHYSRAGQTKIIDRILAVDATTLVIAGDLAQATTDAWAYAISKFAAYCSDVIYVPGNHEYYYSNPVEVAGIFAEMADKYSNLHILDCTEVIIEGVEFAGASLWFEDSQDARVHRSHLNDYRYIKDFEPWAYEQSNRARGFFKNTTASVFVSHHLPHYRSIAERYQDNPLNCFYLNELIQGAYALPRLWIHGHTHNHYDYAIPSTYPGLDCRVIANPLGYRGESSGYDVGKVVDFDDLTWTATQP